VQDSDFGVQTPGQDSAAGAPGFYTWPVSTPAYFAAAAAEEWNTLTLLLQKTVGRFKPRQPA